MLTQKNHVILIQHLTNMVFKIKLIMERKVKNHKKIKLISNFCLFISLFIFVSCDYAHYHEIPSIMVKNNTNQTIYLQYFGELNHEYEVLYRHASSLDTHCVILEPKEMYFFSNGGIHETLGGDECDYVYNQHDHSFILSADSKGAYFMVVDNNDQEKVLKKWTPDYDSNSPFKEFYRLSDWKFVKDGGVRDNDAYIFEIDESDLISK